MNIDNQLLLGLVLITAGIALALLAYAVLLNRRGSTDDELTVDDEVEEGAEPVEAEATVPGSLGDQAGAPIPGFEEPTRLVSQPAAPPSVEDTVLAPPPVTEETEPAEVAPPAQAEPDQDEPLEAEAPPSRAETEGGEPIDVPPVALHRDPASGKLSIKIGDRVFGSMSEVKKSETWEQVSGLFEELHAWMTVVPPQAPATKRTDGGGAAEPTKKPPAALSMVEEINEILEEKLAASATAPQGVHLAEGADGSIRVFIGVQGYAMDKVPDDEVRQLIREAVSEWESRA